MGEQMRQLISTAGDESAAITSNLYGSGTFQRIMDSLGATFHFFSLGNLVANGSSGQKIEEGHSQAKPIIHDDEQEDSLAAWNLSRIPTSSLDHRPPRHSTPVSRTSSKGTQYSPAGSSSEDMDQENQRPHCERGPNKPRSSGGKAMAYFVWKGHYFLRCGFACPADMDESHFGNVEHSRLDQTQEQDEEEKGAAQSTNESESDTKIGETMAEFVAGCKECTRNGNGRRKKDNEAVQCPVCFSSLQLIILNLQQKKQKKKKQNERRERTTTKTLAGTTAEGTVTNDPPSNEFNKDGDGAEANRGRGTSRSISRVTGDKGRDRPSREQKFKCKSKDCGQSFHSKVLFQEHQRLEHNKLFICDICHMCYTTGGWLDRHKQAKHHLD